MHAISIHNLEDEVFDKLQARADLLDLSINQLVKRMIRFALTVDEGKPKRDDLAEKNRILDQICGSWTEEDAKAFEALVERKVEPEEWMREDWKDE